MAFDDEADDSVGQLYYFNPRHDDDESSDNWDRYRERLIQNMFGRTGYVFKQRELKRNGEDQARLPKDSAVIVCISPEMSVADKEADTSDAFDLAPQLFRDGCRLLRSTGRIDVDVWQRERLVELKGALNYQPDVVCFSELAYPAPPRQGEDGWSVEALRTASEQRMKFEKGVLATLRRRKMTPFVFLGSYHCTTTLYNVGVIYPWGWETQPAVFQRTRKSTKEGGDPVLIDDQLLPPLFHRKRFPARSLGERARVPNTQELDIYNLPIGRLAVLICSDVVDLNQFLAIARINRDALRRIDFVLVPSFNQSSCQDQRDPMISMCAELSFIANTTVLTVNVNAADPSYPPTQVFCSGSDQLALGLGELGFRPINRAFTEPVKHSSGRQSQLYIFDLNTRDLAALRNARGNVARRAITAGKLKEGQI